MKAVPVAVQASHEHELEAAHGLPEALPPGERVLWQGAPDWRALAVDAFHVRGIAIYFALILALRGGLVLAEGGTAARAALAVLWLAPLAVFALGMLVYMARLSASTTVYTLTNRRVVMRVGIVLTLTFNLPLARIAAAGLRLRPGKGPDHSGAGDIPLELAPGDKIAYFHLWPHARPWKAAHPQPMLRCVPGARDVAALLMQAWSQETGLAHQGMPVAHDARADTGGARQRGPGMAQPA